MRQKAGILLKCAAIVVVMTYLYSCNTPERKTNETEAKAKAAPKVHTVVIRQMKFTPAELNVNKGDTVIWLNKDIVDHNVTEEAGKEWSSGNLSSGKLWSMVAVKSGTYFCTIHPVMKGRLDVK